MTSVVVSIVFQDDESVNQFIHQCADILKQMGLHALQQSGPGTVIISAVQPCVSASLEMPAPELQDDDSIDATSPETTQANLPPDECIVEPAQEEPVAPVTYKDCIVMSIDTTCAVPSCIDQSADRSVLYASNVITHDDAIVFNYCGIEVKFPRAVSADGVMNADSLCDQSIRAVVKFFDENDMHSVLLEVKERPQTAEYDQIIFAKDLTQIFIKTHQEIIRDVSIYHEQY